MFGVVCVVATNTWFRSTTATAEAQQSMTDDNLDEVGDAHPFSPFSNPFVDQRGCIYFLLPALPCYRLRALLALKPFDTVARWGALALDR
jgi:hypothetical protein